MLWSLVKAIIFIGLAIALAFGMAFILETPGGVRIAFAGQEVSLAPITFVIGVVVLLIGFWILLKLAGLLVAVLRFITGDENALKRYWNRNRERRGYDALSEGLIALAAGDGPAAMAKATKAEKLLGRPELTALMNAQAAELTGNRDRAESYYKKLLADDRTRFVGVRGLMKQKMEQGDTKTALKLAQKAFALKPRHVPTLDTLFQLQSHEADWAGARETLNAKFKAKALPRDVVSRRDAVLSLADATAALAAGNKTTASTAALQANRLAPALVPAAVLAARLSVESGNPKQAARILKRAWTAAPHPDLAHAFAALGEGEDPATRHKRFEPLFKQHPEHAETRLIRAELALAEEDFPAARRALGDLADKLPNTRTLAMMAAIERGTGAEETVVRAWLAKAMNAPRGEMWVCSACDHAHAQWAPTCEKCEAFDTLEWKAPTMQENEQPMDVVLPFIIGAHPDTPPQTDDIVEAETVETNAT